MDAVGVVLAAGLGTRVGADGNKAYLPLAGRSMLAWSLDTLTRLPDIQITEGAPIPRGESSLVLALQHMPATFTAGGCPVDHS